MAKKLRKLENCPNCDLPLTGENNFCAECGQENTTKNVSFGLLIRDILDDFFTVDSRFLKSMKPFLTKPGFLTMEFNSGRRVKFMPPLRMYIVFSLLYFIIPPVEDPMTEGQNTAAQSNATPDSMVVELEAPDSNIVRSGSEIGFGTDTLGNQIMNIQLSNMDKERMADPIYRDSMVQELVSTWELDSGSITRQFVEKAMDNVMILVADDGKQFLRNLYDNIPTMMFFLLPLFALLIKLFHFRLKPLYVESIIFSLHFHSFAFLIFSFNAILRYMGVFDDLIELTIVILVSVYLVMSMRRVFKQKYWITILKSFFLSFTYMIMVTCALVITFAFTLYYF